MVAGRAVIALDPSRRRLASQHRDRPVPTRSQELCGGQGEGAGEEFARDLLMQPLEFRAKVIAHELLHLRRDGHGKVFDAVLAHWREEQEAESGAGHRVGRAA